MTDYLSVSALTKYIKYKFDQDPHLQTILIKGELSNFKSIRVVTSTLMSKTTIVSSTRRCLEVTHLNLALHLKKVTKY